MAASMAVTVVALESSMEKHAALFAR